MNRIPSLTVIAAIALTGLQSPLFASDAGTPDKEAMKKVYSEKRPYSPYVERHFPTKVFWGDTHLHTSFSMDAGAFGARLSPKDAYEFAKGNEIISSTGQPVRLSRPLDFLVVADHSDGMGFFPMLYNGDPKVLADPTGRKWYDMIQSGKGAEAAIEIIFGLSNNTIPVAIFPTPGSTAFRGAWEKTIKAADEANDPGVFTAFIGYEWTSNTNGNNLHRNVIFRDGGSKASLVEPYTTVKPLGSDNPRDLWKWMSAYQDKTGGEVLAIAHNGNLSNGQMFPIIESFTGKKIDREYALNRMRWEPLYEITQIKGDGEAHPFLSPNDEFADFETWDKGNLDLSAPKTNDMLEFEYARSALKNGLKLEADLGINPYKFGFVGSTDSHTGLSTAEEENFFGKTSSSEPSPDRISHMFFNNPKTKLSVMDWETSASGYVAVWATENTREALFDAMKRRETYATTGPRILVRFFGGWQFDANDMKTRSPAVAGYQKGVPMGSDLPPIIASTDNNQKVSPTFLVAALRDPIGANLDRIQIVKGWLDAKGVTQEKVYDVAWSNPEKRNIESNGKLSPVGNTVDVPNATWTNTIGAPELITVWKDPDFDPALRAFYYVRVLEIPTPRWITYDAKYFGTKIPPGATTTLQERAYTSPIWYTPKKNK